jgi:hypothetical protein
LWDYGASCKVAGSIFDEIIAFFNLSVSSSRTVALGISNRNEYQKIFLGRKALPALKADNLIAICELIV